MKKKEEKSIKQINKYFNALITFPYTIQIINQSNSQWFQQNLSILKKKR